MDASELEALLGYLESDLGEPGREVAEFVREATRHVRALDDADPNRTAEITAYCLREALNRLPEGVGMSIPHWRSEVDSILQAWELFEQTRQLPGMADSAIEQLREAMEDVERVAEEGPTHARRMVALLVQRSGVEPIRLPPDPVAEYIRLLRRSNGLLHEEATAEEAQELYTDVVALLGRLFTPPVDRRQALIELAQSTGEPDTDDLDDLFRLVTNPHHLATFLANITTPAWLALLDRQDRLPPPGPYWPIGRAVEQLASSHPSEVAEWMMGALDRWGDDGDAAAQIGAVAHRHLPEQHGRTVLEAALERHPRHRQLQSVAARAALEDEASSDFASTVIDCLLEDIGRDGGMRHQRDSLIRHYIDGMTDVTIARDRFEVLVHKLRRAVDDRPYLLLDNAPLTASLQPLDSTVRAIARGVALAARQACSVGVSTEELLARVDRVDDEELRGRLRVQLLLDAGDIPIEWKVAEVAESIRERPPSGDDLALVEHVLSADLGEDQLRPWREAYSDPPDVEDLGTALAEEEVPQTWWLAWAWSSLLPEEITRPWQSAVRVLSAERGGRPSRQALQERRLRSMVPSRSPVSAEEMAELSVSEAAEEIARWRPSSDDPYASARELARTLERDVTDRPVQWAQEMMTHIAGLRQPTYISHLFRGLADAAEEVSAYGSRLVEAVVFVHTNPWEPIELGGDDFDYDPNWRNAEVDGIQLIRNLASANAEFGDRIDDAWRLVLRAAHDRSVPSSLGSSNEDPLTTAINRPCTRALQSAMALAGWQYRQGVDIHSEFFKLLDESLAQSGWGGLEHRAILVSALPFLNTTAPEWLDDRASLLFEGEASDQLGQRTFTLALRWSRPSPWFLERYRDRLLAALAEGVERSFGYVVIGMLWNIAGYEPETLAYEVARLPSESVGGTLEEAARLVSDADTSEDTRTDALRLAEMIIHDEEVTADGLVGFGMWALVEHVDDGVWQDLTRDVLDKTQGRIDFVVDVARRCSTVGDRASLEILSRLLRGVSNDPYERAEVQYQAIDVLRATADELRSSEEWVRLRDVLLEAGRDEAGEI